MEYIITIELDNEAFNTEAHGNDGIINVLKQIITDLNLTGEPPDLNLRDYNGNSCGEAILTSDLPCEAVVSDE